jgi:hypothetical protein
VLADYASGRHTNHLGREFFDHLGSCGTCHEELNRIVNRIEEMHQFGRKREHSGHIRESRALIAGSSESGETIVPRGQALCFIGELKDWRRVAVTWRNERIVISRAAWDGCIPSGGAARQPRV